MIQRSCITFHIFFIFILTFSFNNYAAKKNDEKKSIPKTTQDIQQAKTEFQAFQKKLKEDINDEPIMPFATHAMLIFLDDSEKDEVRAIGMGLIQALRQKACPILVSAHLLVEVLTSRSRMTRKERGLPVEKRYCTNIAKNFELFTTELSDLTLPELKHIITELPDVYLYKAIKDLTDPKEIVARINSWLQSVNVTSLRKDKLLKLFNWIQYDYEKSRTQKEKDELNKSILCAYQPSFNPEEWIIRKPHNYLYLLIPKNYRPAGPLQIKGRKNNESTIIPRSTQLRADQPLTEAELILGLKIDHMEIITDIAMSPLNLESIYSALADLIAESHNFGNYFNDSIDNNTIFVNRDDYRIQLKEKKSYPVYMPTWAIYLTGHGLININIAFLSVNHYKSLINFLDTKIYTKLLIIYSCYVAGYNENKVFEDFDKPFESRTYSFTIVNGALTDSGPPSIATLHSPKIDIATKSFDMQLQVNFSKFVHDTSFSDTINFADTIANILPLARGEIFPGYYSSVPKIRLPGQQWFSVVDVDNRFASIGKILAKTREQPLEITTFFSKKKQDAQNLRGILLYTNIIPFDLIINKDQLAIIPMLPKDEVNYYISKIISTVGFQALVYSFAQTGKNLLPKRFIIGLIETKNRGSKGPVLAEEPLDDRIMLSNIVLRQIIETDLIEGGFKVKFILYFTEVDIFDQNKIYTAEFTSEDVKNNMHLAVREISDKDEKYQIESNFLSTLKLATPATVQYKTGIPEIKKVYESRSHQNLLNYKSFLDLSDPNKDSELAKWRPSYVKESSEVLDKFIQEKRKPLDAKRALFREKKSKEDLTAAEKYELAMIRKLNEYVTLKRWYDGLTPDQKKKLEQEAKQP